MRVYPIFLIGLAKQHCIVVGGGPVAERKVTGLLDAEATVTVISPAVTNQLRLWADAGVITWIPRQYEPGDLQGAFLVMVASDGPQLKARIREEARAEKALLNVADDPDQSTFITGSVVRRGALTVAISTSGCAPALAVRLRQRMERMFGPEYAAFLDLMQQVRGPLAAHYADFQERRARWYALVDADIIDRLREGQLEVARQRIAEIVGEEVRAPSESRNHRGDVGS
jgi:siroheme synthase-like protein